MTEIRDSRHADTVLAALGEQLAAAGERYELLVIGRSTSSFTRWSMRPDPGSTSRIYVLSDPPKKSSWRRRGGRGGTTPLPTTAKP
jgi:hypothetical protein